MDIRDDFRLAMRKYVYSVSIFSNLDSNSNPNAITVSSVTSISMDPPSILVCINKNSKIHESVSVGSKFCINLLKKNHKDLSNICSQKGSNELRFINENWNLDSLPFIKNAQANIFCHVDKIYPYHTHSIVIGIVDDANYLNGISTLTYVDGQYK